MKIRKATDKFYAYVEVTDDEYKAIKSKAISGLAKTIMKIRRGIGYDKKQPIRRS